ncbi:MAG: hypothetical protein KDD63_03105 [Bacteroidetes bacterium]|nr:hypothetical protein [Bacteroidota bacterium]MCB0843585.1 hypothetical protein [Bacteroidota bacterium]MCB0851206.1 hypothetical protein [Bacteroidota bacterium]
MKKSVKQLIGAFILTLGLVAGGLFVISQVSKINDEVVVEKTVEVDMNQTIAAHP